MSESLTQQQAEIHGLATAILLPSASVFGDAIERRPGVAGPLTSVVGIGLFQRAVLTLQRAGIRQLIVLAGQEEDQLKQALGRGPRVTIAVRWMPIREFPLDDPRTWDVLAEEVHGFCLIASARGLFSRPLIESLRRDVQHGQAILVAQPAGRPGAGERRVPVTVRAERLLALGSARGEESGLVAGELLVVPSSLMQSGHAPDSTEDTIPIRSWIERAARDGRVRVLRTDVNPSEWYQDVRTQDDVPRAERRLFSSLKGEFEGFVDRYFNRKLSRWFTRVFLVLGLSPNAITMIATVIGILAAAEFGIGTYSAGILAAALFQLAAVIDCCDGEVARLTFTESPFGAWLDIAMDNVVHMAIFAGIAVGAYQRAAGQDEAWIPLALGAAAIVGNALSFMLVNRAQKIKAASGWKTPVHAAWSDFMLKNVASRDFSVIVLLFALLSKLEWFLWMAATGSIVFAVLMLWVIRPSATSRA
ncbi:MAG TPA: CDP-alcohol phosphatidyltransferase family protein [Nitrospira sp.]|nr:CDP-alcohol phosphatidyltransferase family protein [Nitrospira sp.]